MSTRADVVAHPSGSGGPAWIVKRREIEAAAVNPNRPRGQVRYGPWRKVSSHGSKTEAIAAAGAVVGLYDVGIFHRGKRIVRERA